MKKFNFRLEGVLKLRKFKEDRLKRELGEILKAIAAKNEEIELILKSVDEAYQTQDQVIQEPTAGNMLKFFPYYIEGRKNDLEKKKNELIVLEQRYREVLNKLRQARGEVKVLDKMKEKKLNEHRKEQNKKLENELADILNMKSLSELKG